MKNKILDITIILFLYFFLILNVSANEVFNFKVTEIEIINDGNVIKGLNRGIITNENGVIINADNFEYNKLNNILNLSGNIKIEDTIKSIVIYADKAKYLKNDEKILTHGNSRALNNNGITIEADNFEYNKLLNIFNANGNVKITDEAHEVKMNSKNITYFRNEEKFFTKGKTEAIIQSKYNFKSSDVIFFRNKSKLNSKNKSIIYDDSSTKYELDEFVYLIDEKLLKGKNINVTTNYLKPKSDKLIFSDGFFHFDKKKFKANNTKIILHKDIFDSEREAFINLENPKLNELFKDYYEENDPRIVGTSSKGDENTTIINKGVFTSCKKSDNCPPWSIEAKKITHDKIKKQLIYDSSVLNFFGVPVFYFPKFFHPDPSVDRQSGFLIPQLNETEILGSSLKIPYYKVLSANQDFTFKTNIFDSDIYMFQNEYRKKNNNSNFITDFSITKGYKSSIGSNKKNSLAHFFAKFDADLELEDFENSTLNIFVEKTNNDTYLNIFEQNLSGSDILVANKNSLKSGLKLSLDHDYFNLTSGFSAYETLSGLNSDRYEYVFPYYDFSKTLETKIPGNINFTSSGNNTLRDTNNLRTRIINDINYKSKNFISDLGFLNNFGIYFKNLNALGKNDIAYKSSPQIEGMSIFNVESSFPLIKKQGEYIDYLVPKIAFTINPGDMKDYSTGAQTINADNMFDVNRLALSDSFEAGKSMTIGLDYRKENYADYEKFTEFKIGTIFRDKEENFIPENSTINRKNSNIFGSFTTENFDFINFDYDFALDNNLKTFEKNSIRTELSINNFVTEFIFNELNGKMGTQNSLENTTSIKFNNNNYFTFNTRRNRELNLTEYYNLVYEYKNDCLTAGIKYKKTYYSDRDLLPSEDLMFTISLFPLTVLEQNVEQKFYRGNDLK